MSNHAACPAGAGQRPAGHADHLTRVELTWIAKRIEFWIRFGQSSDVRFLDRIRSLHSFRPGCVFALVRWAANDYGTMISRIDIVRTVSPGEPYQTLPFVRPGGDILLKLSGLPKVGCVLRAIKAIEALGIDPTEVSPDHWRHIHNRLTAGHEPRAYTQDQHRAHLKRLRVEP
ncbi:DUF2840 domain-containing protein [Chelatococcus reniformis]|uniref:Glycosidase n=1 Tax=Chelatococcus reniformis TaxID=1494448 RepID=A0A916UZC2_9HYPH|nr:DUF2840 domain-containing protein [Chelatococcus reniformis]GGC94278.1 hypothetical protein GCM10010994_60080 [Chelatococcus reniformis]